MRRALLALLAAVAALALAGQATAAGRTIYVRNVSTALTDAQVQDAMPAFQSATSEDFAPIWSVDAQLVFLGREPAPADGWRIVIVDQPACWFCDGFHHVAKSTPRAEVGAGDGWQITFSHELFEMLVDPYANRGVLIGKKWYALEVCDPVEANELAYQRTSASGQPVQISDFLTENWFRPHSRGPYDFLRRTSRPLQILEGGYQLLWGRDDWMELGRDPLSRLALAAPSKRS